MDYKINTNVKTMKAVWNAFEEIGIEGVLSGTEMEVSILTVAKKLVKEGKLNEVCQTITGETIDFEMVDWSEVVNILTAFFGSILEPLQEPIEAIYAHIMKYVQKVKAMTG